MALRRLVIGAAALSAARMFQLAASFLTVPILTRLLSPADYGIVAIALAVVALTIYLADGGLGRSLLRSGPLSLEAWSTAHWSMVGFTGVLSLLLVAAAWPLAHFFNEPRLVLVTIALGAIPLFFGGAEIPSTWLLQKEKIGWLAAAEFGSALLGVGAAITLAFAGAGVWALVAQNVLMHAGRWIIVEIASGFRARFVFRIDELRPHIAFTRDTVGSAITMFISRQADPLVIGKVLGAAPLGFYAIAYRLMQLPANIASQPLQGALYPRLARMHADRPAMKSLVLGVTTAQAAIVFPAMTALAIASHSAFTLLLSDKWAPTAALFTAMAVAGMAQTVTSLNGAVLQALGQTGARLRVTVEFAILWAASAVFLVHFGIEAVAWGFTAITLLYTPRLLQKYLKPIGCTLVEFCAALAGPALVSLGILAAHLMLRETLQLGRLEEVLLAVVETLIGQGLYFLVCRRGLMQRLHSVRAALAG